MKISKIASMGVIALALLGANVFAGEFEDGCDTPIKRQVMTLKSNEKIVKFVKFKNNGLLLGAIPNMGGIKIADIIVQ